MGTIIALLTITTAIIVLYYLLMPGKAKNKDKNNDDNNNAFHDNEGSNSLDGYLCPEEGDLPFTLVQQSKLYKVGTVAKIAQSRFP